MKKEWVGVPEEKWRGGGTLVMRSLQLLETNDYNSSVHFNVPLATDVQASNSYFSLR